MAAASSRTASSYGIQGELITDCRYLNIVGARAAIDSETNIAARHKWLDWQRAQFAEFIAHEGQNKRFACTCGWRGHYKDLKKSPSPVYFSCPTCSSRSVMMEVTETPSAKNSPSPSARSRRKKRP